LANHPGHTDRVKKRAREVGRKFINSSSTLRETAQNFGVSKTTIAKDLNLVLPEVDQSVYIQAKKILAENKSQAHIRGGESTKKRFKG